MDDAQALAQEETAVMAIMDGSDKIQHDRWAMGDQGIAKRISDFFAKKYPEPGPATSPSDQNEVLDARPETMSPEAQLSPEQQQNLKVLKDRWGSDYEINTRYVNHAAELFGVSGNAQAMEFLADSGLADDPTFLDLAHQMGRLIASKRG